MAGTTDGEQGLVRATVAAAVVNSNLAVREVGAILHANSLQRQAFEVYGVAPTLTHKDKFERGLVKVVRRARRLGPMREDPEGGLL